MNSNQNIQRLARFLCVAFFVFMLPNGSVIAEPQAPGATFTVNTTADTVDASLGNGICADSGGFCSLRAAIQEANALAGADTITLSSASYELTRAGGGEDAAASGDLDISSTLTIQGTGSAATIIDANDLDRVIHILSTGVVTMTQLTIQDGTPPNVGSDTVARSGGGVRNDGRLTLSYARVRANRAANGAVAAYPASSGGYGGGIFSGFNSTLTLEHVWVDANFAGNGASGDMNSNGTGGNGGGLATSNATLTIQNSEIMNNWAGDAGDSSNSCTAGAGNGGGIYLTGGTLLIENTTISSNLSGMGGDSAGAAIGCSGGSGGGVYANNAITTINDSSFEGNYTQTGGTGGFGCGGGDACSGGVGGTGGGIIFMSGSLTLNNVTIHNNHTAGGRAPTSAGGNGGGIWCYGSIHATDLTLTNNVTGDGAPGGAQGYYGGNGGGMYAANCLGSITGGRIAGNHTGNGGAGTEIGSYGGYGGAIYSNNGETPLELVNMSIENNFTGNGGAAPDPGNGGRGGGIYAESAVNLTGVTLAGNYTGNGEIGGDGGGFYGIGTITNSTISNNHTGSPGASGGGILVYNSMNPGNVNLRSSTVAFNLASGSGGGVRSQFSRFYARNSILSNNSAVGGHPDCSGLMQSEGYNLLASTAGCSITLGGGEVLNANPRLLSLTDNGGPTKTHAFLLSSPALDRANPAAPGSSATACPATDQRGNARTDLRCDIGAYEAVSGGGSVVVSQQVAAGATVSFGPGMAGITLNSSDPITGTVQRSGDDPTGFPNDHDVLGITTVITVTEGTGGGLLAPLAFNLDLSLCYTTDEASGLNPSQLQMYRWEGSVWTPLGGVSDVAQRCVKRSGVTQGGTYALAVPPEHIFLPIAMK